MSFRNEGATRADEASSISDAVSGRGDGTPTTLPAPRSTFFAAPRLMPHALPTWDGESNDRMILEMVFDGHFDHSLSRALWHAQSFLSSQPVTSPSER